MSIVATDDRFTELYEISLGLIETYHQGALEKKRIATKAGNDVVTSLDRLLDRHIHRTLANIDPTVRIISEERIGDAANADIGVHETCWLVDPLDGTANFVQDLPTQAISFAKCRGHDILEAVTIDVQSGNVFVALLNRGCQRNGSTLTAKSNSIAISGVSTGWLRAAPANEVTEVVNGGKVRLLGSQAMHLIMVAQGSFVSTFSDEARAWDDVAGALIVREMGGRYYSPALNKSQGWIDLALRDEPMRSQAYSGLGVRG